MGANFGREQRGRNRLRRAWQLRLGGEDIVSSMMGQIPVVARVFVSLSLILIATLGCARSEAPSRNRLLEAVSPPTGPEAMAPFLAVDGEDLLLSWLEPGHRFLMSRLHAGRWSEPVAIAEGPDFFANWADVPKVAVAADGTLWAHWLAKIGEDTYAYGIFLARSLDGGASWEPMGTLHDDDSPTEHGFVAWAPEGTGLRAVWLDGREMLDGGPMALRTAHVGAEVGPAEVLDDRVCECCPTALTVPASGPLALYRDRSEDEIRNIAVARGSADGWEPLRPIHPDDWRIAGCPVNGPAVDSAGDHVAAAWFTAADESPRVQLAFSVDGGAEFSDPLVVDPDRPLGRVGLALDTDGSAWVSWLSVIGDVAQVRLARFDASGRQEDLVAADTGSSRASGIPRLTRLGDVLYLAWVETADDRPSGIGLARLPLS